MNTWIGLPGNLANTPAARTAHTAVWTGVEMIIWGGLNGPALYAEGGRFNPALNRWTTIPNTLANAPAARSAHTAVWTGAQMLVWSGLGTGYFSDTFGFVPGRVIPLSAALTTGGKSARNMSRFTNRRGDQQGWRMSINILIHQHERQSLQRMADFLRHHASFHIAGLAGTMLG